MADQTKSDIKTYVSSFIIAGVIVTAIKYIAQNATNPGLAAVAGATPLGLMSIYFLTSEKSIPYAYSYFYITIILASSILLFYMLRIHTEMDKNLVLLFALLFWAGMVTLYYLYTNKNK